MLVVETLSALMSTDRTPLAGGPTVTRSDQPGALSSATLSATPPLLGRRRLREMFWKFHLLPRCWSSTIRLPFFKPISLRFCPSSPVRLRLSSQSRPASSPLAGSRLSEAAAVAAGGVSDDDGATWPRGIGSADWPVGGGISPGCLFDATPVASGRALS